MTLESKDRPPIPYSRLPGWSINMHSDLKQPTDEVLLVDTSHWMKLAGVVWTVAVCILCAAFVMPLFKSLTIDEYRMAVDVAPFAWPAFIIVFIHVLLLIALITLPPVRFDHNTQSVGRDGWIPGGWQRDLEDVLAIQICLGKTIVIQADRARDERIKLQYQLNLVFHDSPPSRINVCQLSNLRRIERYAREISKFLNKPILNYVGYSPGKPGTLKKAHAEARRLLK